MPEKYVKMRDQFKSQGMSDKNAKAKAARIFNSQRKPGEKPVTRSEAADMIGNTDTPITEATMKNTKGSTKKLFESITTENVASARSEFDTLIRAKITNLVEAFRKHEAKNLIKIK